MIYKRLNSGRPRRTPQISGISKLADCGGTLTYFCPIAEIDFQKTSFMFGVAAGLFELKFGSFQKVRHRACNATR